VLELDRVAAHCGQESVDPAAVSQNQHVRDAGGWHRRNEGRQQQTCRLESCHFITPDKDSNRVTPLIG
jgi:hypothetical protein